MRRISAIAKYLRHDPRGLREMPRWLRDRRATPLKLRQPWWPYRATEFLAAVLPPAPRVFEFGGGGSTLWFEDRDAAVITVEHDPEWMRALAAAVREGTELIHRAPAPAGGIDTPVEDGYFDDYVATVEDYEDESFDLIVVDGRCRVEAGLRSIPKLRRGGWLLLDDSWRPRYARLGQELASYETHSFSGLVPGGGVPCMSTCWKKPLTHP